MNRPDIEAVKEAFSQGAKRAKAAGFDLVEIIACTGYLISQFLSRYESPDGRIRRGAGKPDALWSGSH